MPFWYSLQYSRGCGNAPLSFTLIINNLRRNVVIDPNTFKVEKAKPKGFKLTMENVLLGLFCVFLVGGGILTTQIESKPTMTFSQCVAQVSTSPNTFENTLVMESGEELNAEFTRVPTSNGYERSVNVRLHIPKADRIIDMDVVDGDTFAVSYAMGEEVSVQIVERRRHWAFCDTDIYINDLVAVPGAG
jgi:hypothetical protein